MVYEGLSKSEDTSVNNCDDPSRGGTLVMLSVATSIDALGIGLSLGLLDVDVISASILIGVVSLILSIVGLLSGKFLNKQFGKIVEVIGGSVLIFIGLRIVVTHLMA